ncbi:MULTISPECIES: SPFH domain-containing protein [unclassified Clostridioides]|uniref:SPFH domain-containing protein n=1 Tax=unclassified Clostridioides TaxID=2635829 RepID=UPI001D0CB3C3|nr:SPFH/Band 7/PHB domain protein [Clostridioides sp. ZZV15-6388]MCC0636085.1 SPFH/Band 7/PHB domain protein [Clostridioides sp. ES-S-0001-02]MCC0641641.1 SPFH/Band 7/PHB domain protein [Clostridioides sp. ES-S-0049-03]MCC0646125.1 SPFH/Band 7/PHB domain protein [Clostridioides sp. ZZV14-6150]MCC0653197.1 SPFH/Band 7/PHB domain protein [Clostridioides sp. ES-S-0001-03]MCC0656795.1 SPFH/Band 7/PHB domain protein [Clostridioides sp. ES-S-0123-01]MCC0665590.1 SPFH/Band 7/PHB domain protein [Clos
MGMKVVLSIVLIIVVVAISLTCIRVIKQSKVGIIMRLGKFQKVAETGVHFLIPFLDKMAYVIDLREIVIDFPPQPVITKDNVTMQIDTVVYYKVTDPVRYVFEIANPIAAIENLTATTLRNIIGELDLDETLTSRDIINVKMRTILDEATDKWGIKVNRVELKNIMPPHDIQVAMEKQMRAERERREAILQAEGNKSAAILQAEGEKQSAILTAEARKEAMVRVAEGEKESAILVAEGEAEAIRQTAIAKAQGEAEMIKRTQMATAEGLKLVFSAMKESDIDNNILALKSMEALEKMAEGKSTKLVLPSEAVNFLGTFKGIKEVMSDDKNDILDVKDAFSGNDSLKK